MEMSDVAAGGFVAGADAYERARPSYPPDVVAWIVERCAIGEGTDVVDLAAGTGKLTRLLVPTGASLVAVEPVDEMRAKLTEACPDVRALAGTAEAIPLPDASVDVVTVAQAFHWFDPERALAEIARVLRPGGQLALVFNERDARVPWVGELSKLIRWDERERWRVPYTVEVDWAATIARHGPRFGPAQRLTSGFDQPMDPDLLVQRVLSTSYVALLPADEQEALARRVRELGQRQGTSFALPYVTHAYVAALEG